MGTQTKDMLTDDRDKTAFIPIRLDELGLSLEAFRVYCHIVRRTNKETHTAWPSYKKIGEICFRGSYPNSSAASLKKKAIDAVTELTLYGLITKETIECQAFSVTRQLDSRV